MVLLIIVLALSCSGCLHITIDEGYELKQDISQIKVIDLFYNSDENFNQTFESPLATLEASRFEAFVNDLETLPFVSKMTLVLFPVAVDPSDGFGQYTIRIEYQDGSYEMISDFGYQVYRSSDDAHISSDNYEIDDETWYDFLEKYFGQAVLKPE